MKHFFTVFKTFTICTVLSLPTVTFSQSPRAIESQQRIMADSKVSGLVISSERQTPSLIALQSKGTTYTKAEIKPVLANYLGVRGGIDEPKMDKTTSMGDVEVIEFQQYFKGVKVDRAKFKAHLKKGSLDLMNGAWYDIPATTSTTPTLTKSEALVFAKTRVAASLYMSDLIQKNINETADLKVKEALFREMQQSGPAGEVVFIKNFNKENVAEMRLAYKFNIYAAKPLSRSWVYVDAKNGEILLIDAIIKHVNEAPTNTASVPTMVQTRYAGLKSIQVKQISGNDPNNGLPLVSSNPFEIYVPGAPTYALIDDTRGNGVETYDLNGVGGLPLSLPALYSQAKSFTDVNNNWTLAEHKRGGANEAENDDFGWDAHWGAGVVYDYWNVTHNRLSYDGQNTKIRSFIHSGLAFDNAFWNGSVMTYGDGSGTAANGFKPLTSLDVCAHEVGHGVCEFTADLVYAKESGAMNEGYSDIWAACAEYFAIKTVDPTLASVYKPFYIGEQISATPEDPLRRMDNPKAAGDPDTYGGQLWVNPNCSPSLANDQCGVHNNSGVLNKWFYLLSVGSGAGSGPDAIYAGEDDGVNDAVTTGPVELQHPANVYQVNGVGFEVAENIAYQTELLLTTTATFAEAREVSIAIATSISGNPCSPLVESVTNSWYAVGVGDKFVKPCTITFGFVMQPGAAVSEGTALNGCAATKTFNIPVILPANSTASVAVTGNANAFDYTLSATQLSNTTSTIAKRDIVVTIKNDGAVEGDEFVQLNLSVSNAGANPVRTSYKLTILDDDAVPVIGNGQRTLLSETFTRADGFNDPAGWVEILELPEAPNGDPAAAGKNQWGVFDNTLSVTGKEGTTGTQLPNGTYNNNSPSQTLIKSPLLDARGLSVVTLKFDYTIQGEIDPAGAADDPENLPVFDYMAIAFSLDGVNFTELNTGDFRQFASATPTSGTITGTLPASLANKQFYIAFRWHNDTNAGGPISASVDNLTVTAASRKIENDLNHGGRENLSPGQEVYFFSTQDGEVLAKVLNNSTKDFGCSNVYVEKAGTGTFNLYQSNQGLFKVSDKVVRIETTFGFKVSTSVTLYYTEAQLQNLEAATGQSRNSFSIFQVQAAAYTNASGMNTKRYTPVITAIPGVGAFYTISFNDRVNGSYALGTQVTLFSLNANRGSEENISNKAMEPTEWKFEKISPNPVQGDALITVSAPKLQQVTMEIINTIAQRSSKNNVYIQQGVSRLRIPTAQLATGKYVITFVDENGRILNSQQFIKL